MNNDDNINESDIDTSINYVEKKIEKIKKNKNIKKTETMITKAKTKLSESEEKIEILEKELNNDNIYIKNINIENVNKEMNIETLFKELNLLNDQIKNSINIEEGIQMYIQMTHIIKLIKSQLNSFKMEIMHV